MTVKRPERRPESGWSRKLAEFPASAERTLPALRTGYLRMPNSGWRPISISWSSSARMLSELFKEQGVLKEWAWIRAETVRHGDQKKARAPGAPTAPRRGGRPRRPGRQVCRLLSVECESRSRRTTTCPWWPPQASLRLGLVRWALTHIAANLSHGLQPLTTGVVAPPKKAGRPTLLFEA
jgi:hypothetical protein